MTSTDPGFQGSSDTKMSLIFTGSDNHSDLPTESYETFGIANVTYHASGNNTLIGDLELNTPNKT